MSVPSRCVVLAGALLALAPLATALDAQRRPGVGMGFYTYTGLLSAELEGGSVVSSTAYVEAPAFAVSGLGTAPLWRGRKRAWIAGVRVTPLNVGNRGCFVVSRVPGCQDVRHEERLALLTGAALDIRSTLLRVMAGPAVVNAGGRGARLGTTLRLDYTAPRQGTSFPTLFLTRTFLGSERGTTAGLTTLGAGFRWVRKR
ncbi:MAG: hypothetical protein KJT01_14210 [Gemmatimonadetes bacterium]|nr:hypothetical protein [Gemmatimonadota bacterium]